MRRDLEGTREVPGLKRAAAAIGGLPWESLLIWAGLFLAI